MERESMMKLFIKDHLGLLFTQFAQMTLFCLMISLTRFNDYAILLYGVFINLFILFVYLSAYYYRRRHYYQKLSVHSTDLQELLEITDDTPVGQALDCLTKAQYQLFMKQLKDAENDQVNHLKFIDRWVHQMKTPLSVIDLTAKELDEPESSNIREETERLQKGLNTVLYMARMRTIEDDFHIQPVELERLIQEVNQINKRFYIRNEVYPHLIIKDEHLIVETDEKWLFFIIDQLINNAVKYTNGKSNRIDIILCKQKGKAILAIRDQGIGIPEHDKNRIFQAFYTGDNGRKFRESTGMGLYLSKEIADYLGHHLEVESTLDTGTTFRMIFTETQTIN